eukprot:3031372-Rhodomonas_salina.1
MTYGALERDLTGSSVTYGAVTHIIEAAGASVVALASLWLSDVTYGAASVTCGEQSPRRSGGRQYCRAR